MNKQTQNGMTTIGWILVIGIFGIIVVTGMKILPLYLDYFTVRSVMEGVATDPEVDPKSKRDLWTAISKRLRINSVRTLKRENFVFSRNDGVTTVKVDYIAQNPYIAQLFIGGHFTYSVEIKR